jgi:hypothetical protein
MEICSWIVRLLPSSGGPLDSHRQLMPEAMLRENRRKWHTKHWRGQKRSQTEIETIDGADINHDNGLDAISFYTIKSIIHSPKHCSLNPPFYNFVPFPLPKTNIQSPNLRFPTKLSFLIISALADFGNATVTMSRNTTPEPFESNTREVARKNGSDPDPDPPVSPPYAYPRIRYHSADTNFFFSQCHHTSNQSPTSFRLTFPASSWPNPGTRAEPRLASSFPTVRVFGTLWFSGSYSPSTRFQSCPTNILLAVSSFYPNKINILPVKMMPHPRKLDLMRLVNTSPSKSITRMGQKRLLHVINRLPTDQAGTNRPVDAETSRPMTVTENLSNSPSCDYILFWVCHLLVWWVCIFTPVLSMLCRRGMALWSPVRCMCGFFYSSLFFFHL